MPPANDGATTRPQPRVLRGCNVVLLSMLAALLLAILAFQIASVWTCHGDQQLKIAVDTGGIATALFFFLVSRNLHMNLGVRIVLSLTIGSIVFLATALPASTALQAVDTSRQKKASDEIREIALWLGVYATDHGQYPSASDIDTLAAIVNPRLPRKDPWGNAYVIRSAGSNYEIRSLGGCGRADPEPRAPGEVMDVEGDLVFRNGAFIRWCGRCPPQ
jgi:hypothetical protein